MDRSTLLGHCSHLLFLIALVPLHLPNCHGGTPSIPIEVRVHPEIVRRLHVKPKSTFLDVREHLQESLRSQLSSERTTLVELRFNNFSLLDSDSVVDILYSDCNTGSHHAVTGLEAVWGFSYLVHPPASCSGKSIEPISLSMLPDASAGSLVEAVTNLVDFRNMWPHCRNGSIVDILATPSEGHTGKKWLLTSHPNSRLTDLLPEEEHSVVLRSLDLSDMVNSASSK